MMTTNMKRFKKDLKEIDMRASFVKTGHDDWYRCFITKNGVTYARVSFYQGALHNINWYVGAFNIPFEKFYLSMLYNHGTRVDKLIYDKAVVESKRIALEQHKALLEKREKNKHRSDGSLIKRRRLAEPNYENYLHEVYCKLAKDTEL